MVGPVGLEQSKKILREIKGKGESREYASICKFVRRVEAPGSPKRKKGKKTEKKKSKQLSSREDESK